MHSYMWGDELCERVALDRSVHELKWLSLWLDGIDATADAPCEEGEVPEVCTDVNEAALRRIVEYGCENVGFHLVPYLGAQRKCHLTNRQLGTCRDQTLMEATKKHRILCFAYPCNQDR